MSILYPARAWQPDRSRVVALYHGCTSDDRKNIEKNGIQVNLCRADTDFGRGFYTTTLRRQARQWAWIRYYGPGVRRKGNQPVILRFVVEREALGRLDAIAFVRGDFNSLDFWSLVQHCRQSSSGNVRHHERSTGCSSSFGIGTILRAGPWQHSGNSALQCRARTSSAFTHRRRLMPS